MCTFNPLWISVILVQSILIYLIGESECNPEVHVNEAPDEHGHEGRGEDAVRSLGYKAGGEEEHGN